MRRRSALATIALATVQPQFSCGRGAASPLDRKALVVGAGMAGIAAASRLKSSGFEVTVLEARRRIGGRVWTDCSLGTAVDLGAAWLEDASHNPLADLARQ